MTREFAACNSQGADTAAFGMGLEILGMLAAAGLAWVNAPGWLPAPLFLIGVAQGIALTALVRLNVDQVEARWAGLAAGLVSDTLQISAAVSTATIGGLFFALWSHGTGPGAVKTAFSVALLATLRAWRWQRYGAASPRQCLEIRSSSPIGALVLQPHPQGLHVSGLSWQRTCGHAGSARRGHPTGGPCACAAGAWAAHPGRHATAHLVYEVAAAQGVDRLPWRCPSACGCAQASSSQ